MARERETKPTGATDRARPTKRRATLGAEKPQPAGTRPGAARAATSGGSGKARAGAAEQAPRRSLADAVRGIVARRGNAAAPDGPDASARPARGPRARRRPAAGEHSELAERLIAGVPARIMRPRLVFISCLVAILAFGLLMVYSASAVEALAEEGSSVHFLIRQGGFILAGLICMAVVTQVPLSIMRSRVVWWAWIAMLLLLVAVLVVGVDAGGARRWINLGIRLQPSEFAKPVIIVTAAMIFHRYYEEGALATSSFLALLALCVFVPLAAIIAEPDLGSCLIIGGTIFAMCYLAGFSYWVFVPLAIAAAALAIGFVVTSGYRMARLMSDPWADPYGDGYQATLAIMAFASGGLFGRGIGNSTMKYHYLPEAHNDYILAIIGEELGFIGMLVFIAVYLIMVLAAFKIASRAPTVQGRMIGYGAAVLIMLQFLVNALGILGVTPMTGKTMPFISYGGSSMIAMLIVAGLIIRVSIESGAATVYDERRGRMAVVGPDDDLAALDGSTAGEARPRSARGGFTVVDGYSMVDEPARPHPVGRRAGATPGAGARGRGADARGSGRAGGGRRGGSGAGSRGGSYERVDLGWDPAERLRSRGSRRRDEGTDDWRPHGR